MKMLFSFVCAEVLHSTTFLIWSNQVSCLLVTDTGFSVSHEGTISPLPLPSADPHHNQYQRLKPVHHTTLYGHPCPSCKSLPDCSFAMNGAPAWFSWTDYLFLPPASTLVKYTLRVFPLQKDIFGKRRCFLIWVFNDEDLFFAGRESLDSDFILNEENCWNLTFMLR